jgi:hypothetical protein
VPTATASAVPAPRGDDRRLALRSDRRAMHEPTSSPGQQTRDGSRRSADPCRKPRSPPSAPSSATSATPSTASRSSTPTEPRRRAREGTQERHCRPAWPAHILHTGSPDQATPRTRQATVRSSPAGHFLSPTHAPNHDLTQRGFGRGHVRLRAGRAGHGCRHSRHRRWGAGPTTGGDQGRVAAGCRLLAAVDRRSGISAGFARRGTFVRRW